MNYARLLVQAGELVVGISDVNHGWHNPVGLSLEDLGEDFIVIPDMFNDFVAQHVRDAVIAVYQRAEQRGVTLRTAMFEVAALRLFEAMPRPT